MTVWTDNAAAFATRPEQRIRELRRDHVSRAVDALVAGDPAGARVIMNVGLARQALVAGVRLVDATGSAA